MTAVSIALLGSALVVTPAAASGGVSLSTILSGYDDPVFVTAPKGGSRTIFIVERVGRIRVATYRDGADHKAGTFLDIRSRVKSTYGEQGLLGLAFDPDYAHNRRFYVDYTRKGDGDTVVAEFRRSSSSSRRASASTFRQVIRINQPYSNHNGGMLAFGPDDGYLYIGTGDGGSGGDPGNRAQSKTSLLGKILRIRPYRSGGRAYTVPSGNPFVGRPGWDAIWSYGLRNPWRFSFDRSNGDLCIGDVGQSRYEEVDLATGRAAGASTTAGGPVRGQPEVSSRRHLRHGQDGPSRSTGTDEPHCSITGGYAYRGPDYARWQGRYIYGDYCSGKMWVIDRLRFGARATRDTAYRHLKLRRGWSAGRLFMTDLGGRILSVRFRGSP
ncbi:MAG: PQQ-dependent sugar dehydrogenase [Chloroflexota bacterium]